MTIFDETLAEGLGFGSTLEQLRRTDAPALTDDLRTTDAPAVLRLIPVTETQGIGFASELLELVGVVIREQLKLSGETDVAHRQQVYLADVLRVAESLINSYPLALSDGIGFAASHAVAQSVQLIEQLQLSEALTGNGRYNITIEQALRLADGLHQFFGAEVDEGISFAVDLAVRKLAITTVDEGLGFADTLAPLLLVNVTVDEGIEITAETAVQMLFNPVIHEGIEITAAYVSPTGSMTTWAMNARTGAVTEYRNYEFNSFAKIGNRYIGASESGLYELLGDTDEGASIVARIKGGFLQFGGTHLSRLSAAYIATRGEGDFVLRIITGEGATYNYAVSTRNMRSVKVHMGKGQRARYFSYELISAGQDFDLDTLEFVPVVVQRRV